MRMSIRSRFLFGFLGTIAVGRCNGVETRVTANVYAEGDGKLGILVVRGRLADHHMP